MATLVDLLQSFKDRGTAPALIFYDSKVKRQVVTYKQLYNAALNFAGHLKSYGIKPGDRVVLKMSNHPAWLGAFFGILAAGGVVVPININLLEEQTESLGQLAGAKLILHREKEFSGKKIKSLRLDIDWFNKPVKFLPITPEPKDLAQILFTSGTTGEPKLVGLTHKNLVSNLNQLNKAMPEITSGSSFLACLAFDGILQLTAGLFLPLSKGSAIVIPSSLEPLHLFNLWLKEKIAVIVGVPRLLRVLKNYLGQEKLSTRLAGIKKTKGSFFQFFISGAFALQKDLAEFWGGLGFLVLEGYGLTECSPVLAVNRPNQNLPGSVGLPLPGVELKIEDGEILAKGDNVFAGYLNAPDENIFTKDGWFKTGDLGKIDKNGFVYIDGRREDLESQSGEILPIADFEQAILAIAGVKEVCVMEIQNKFKAIVVIENGADKEIIGNKSKDLVFSGKGLDEVVFWPTKALPKTLTGKIQKFKIKKRLLLAS